MALSYCQWDVDGDLCTITSFRENELIRKITERSTHREDGIWIGLSNIGTLGTHPQWTDGKVSITL